MPTKRLFKENLGDQIKNQSYKNDTKVYELPDKYYLLEMYDKQKELQQFLAEKGKTEQFPNNLKEVTQKDVQLAIYHLFCMQVEYSELDNELVKLDSVQEGPIDTLDARYELIDMFFFMFNVGIYTGLDIMSVVNRVQGFVRCTSNESISNTKDIRFAIYDLLNYIDKLPWKAWKEYDYSTFNFSNPDIIHYYALALHYLLEYARKAFNETTASLFNLYMNKWVENKRRQEDVNSGYILKS